MTSMLRITRRMPAFARLTIQRNLDAFHDRPLRPRPTTSSPLLEALIVHDGVLSRKVSTKQKPKSCDDLL